MQGATYKVPVIPQNLRKEETIIQIAESLNYLSQVTNDVIKRINDRIELNSSNLLKLTTRINAVSSKINSIAGAKKAIQVFSSSRYPATDVNRHYKSVFDDKNCPEMTSYSTEYKDIQFKDEPLETLQFYHVKVPDKSVTKCDGLGDIPKDVQAINDLLLYNSGQNPYSKYVMSDTLQMLHTTKREDVAEGPEIGAAPLSITERTALSKMAGDNYFYSPNLGDVPAIDVPLDLPDLPGIADDLRYIHETGPGIAPSVTTTPNIPDLPEIITSNKQDSSENVHTHNSEISIDVTTEVISEQVATIPNDEQRNAENAKESAMKDEPKTEVSHKHVKKAVEISDVHATLMDAIRKAGGTKNLKSTEPKKVTKSPLGGGDLMADLHAKLTLRRKGISGAKNAEGVEPGSAAMTKISAMIPPPSAQTEQSETATTDDDWDD